MSGASRPLASTMPAEAPVRPTLADRFRRWRASVVADPRFRRFSARFVLTRPIARRETARLFDLTAGFVYSQILSAFVRLGLVEQLHAGDRTAAEIGAACGLSEQRADRLLRGAVALGLAEKRSSGRFGLGMLGAALVGNDGVRAMIEHHAILYGDLADPVGLLRGQSEPRMASFWDYRDEPCAEAERYSRLMAASQAFVAGEILDALRVEGSGTLLDIGGGEGAFVEAVAARHPDMRLMLFDLPAVAERAKARVADAGLASRVDVHAGSFLTDEIPTGSDLVTLVRVLHDHDDTAALTILRAIRKALPAGGRLVVAEPMAGTPGAERAGDAYFGFYLLAMGRGRPRRFEDIEAMLRTAGFRAVRELRTATPLLIRVVQAEA